ncbi:hypothetical protein ACOMHN_007562 [Nucella lapillus]
MRMAGGQMKSVEEIEMKGDELVEGGRERAGVGGQGHSERVAESEQAGNVAADSATAEKPGSPEQPAWPGREYKAPSVQVPVNTSTELQALLSAGLQLSAVVAAEIGGLALLEVQRSLHNTTHVAFPLVVMGPGTHTGDDSR